MSSLLGSFLLLFETDAKDATKEVEGLDSALDGVSDSAPEAAKGVDGLSESASAGSMSLGDLTKTVGGLLAAFASVDVIASGVLDNALAIDTVGKFSQTLGENIVEVDAWGEAVARNGGSADAFMGSVESLNTSLADIKISGGSEIIDTLAMMGVTATSAGGQVKSAFDVLPELADSFQSMSANESFSFGKKLGLDQGTILLLQQGRTAVDDLVERQKMLGGVTEEGYEAAAIFNDQLDDSKRVFNSLWMSGNSTILPLLTDMLKAFESVVLWVRQNQELVTGFFIGVAGAITIAYLPAITSAAAATLVAVAPFVAIGAAIAAVGVAVAVLYEDFQAWTNGSSSLLGDVLGDFESFKESILSIFDSIAEKWNAFSDGFADSVKVVGEFLGLIDEETAEGGDQKATTPKPYGQMKQNTDTAMSTAYAYGANPLNNGGASSYKQKNQNINVEVGGATIDARGMTGEQAQQAFSSSLNDNLKNTLGQMDDGVDY